MAEEEPKHHLPPAPEEEDEEAQAAAAAAARDPRQDFKHEQCDKGQHQTLPRNRMADGKSFARDQRPEGTRRRVCAAIVILLLLVGVTALIVYLVYRPENPRFSVVGAAVYDLNTSTLPLLTTTMQFTIMARNPNRRVSIYYDHLSAYVSYRNQAITPPLALPPLYHERRRTVAVSPVLGGVAVPVAPEVANGLAMDEEYGVVGLRVVVTGRLRWKAGAIRTGHYGLYVRCDVMVGLRKGAVGQPPLLGSTGCKVDV